MLKDIKQLLDKYRFFIAVFFTLLVTFLSLASVKSPIITEIQSADKFGHTIAYFVLSLAWLFAYHYQKKHNILIFTGLVVYGIIIEILQGLVTTYRKADIYDVFANTVGICIAFLLYHFVVRKILT
ncbi:MAG: hypothetical protein CSA39_00845 [Flavobacteriales bacterium]|nr:MAG: hypothetical protein CSA39_00845 [Flavobacteriales bacterium]